MSSNTVTALTLTRTFDVPVQQLFDAWTDPAQVTQWMGPGEVKCLDVQIDLKVGGEYRIHMRSDEGDHVAIGEYVEVTPPDRLKFTWSWESGAVVDTLVTLDFQSRGEGSELTLTHENFVEQEAMEKHTQGWDGCLAKLTNYLA
jgi:uncharacterized protein YndB with AHSA1/START domain